MKNIEISTYNIKLFYIIQKINIDQYKLIKEI
jgi:hypothetical protein